MRRALVSTVPRTPVSEAAPVPSAARLRAVVAAEPATPFNDARGGGIRRRAGVA